MQATVRWSIVWLTLTVASPLLAADAPAIDPLWRERIRTEGRATHERYVALTKRLEIHSETHFARQAEARGTVPFQPSTRRLRTVRVGDNMIWYETRVADGAKTPPETQVQCDTDDYHFTLTKGASGYLLANYAPGSRKLSLIQQGGVPGLDFISELGETFDAVASTGKYRLKALAWDKSKELLHIQYTVQVSDSQATVDDWVEPKHSWRPVERRVETKSGVFTNRLSYGHLVDGLDFPTVHKNHSHYKVNPAPPDLEITSQITSVAISDKEPRDFRLTAFGLPEPVDAATRPKETPRYVWFLIAAAAFGMIAIGLRMAVRGRNRGVAEKS